MKTNLFNARHHARVGPGGWFCNCCGPSPSDRKSIARKHKKSMYRYMDKEIRKELNDA